VRACRSSVRVVASVLLFRAVSVVRYEYYSDEPPSVTSLAYALPSFLLPPSLPPSLPFSFLLAPPLSTVCLRSISDGRRQEGQNQEGNQALW